jgi:prepilin-type N-terminal cleavage/methylation domain-containing protein
VSRPVPPRHRAGFTLLELIIALSIGLVVLTTATALAAGTWQSVRGVTLRDGVTRNARYVAATLQRDVQETGVDLSSAADFGTLATYGDTIVILRVPYAPAAPTQYGINPANFANGVCGAACLDISTGAGNPVPDFVAGDLARVQISNTRRLIYVTAVSAVAGGYRVRFNAATRLLHHAAGLGGVVVTAAGTFVQKVGVVMYYRTGTQLMRATSLSAGLVPQGELIATGVQLFTPRLVFTDGNVVAQADSGTDANATNDYDDIAALRVAATIQGDRTDPRVNNGQPVIKQLQWWFAPRNLIYERNRA